MALIRRALDRLRSHTNRRLDLDLVRASGHHTLRTHLPQAMSLYGIKTVIDVGANEGQFGALIRESGFKGNIVSFEPVAGPYQKLCERSKSDSRWTTHRMALGDSTGEVEINVSSNSQFSSIFPATDFGNTWEEMEVKSREVATLSTLDACLADGIIPSDGPFLLKIDTQGYDLHVFAGAKTLLPATKCLVSEISLTPLYEGMTHYLEALRIYEAAGFKISGLYTVTRSTSLALNEVDCVMIRQEP